ncbi:MAG TPA: GNAT family N-acetyltransferase [Verrucomicrobiae bacterium]|nr:GNAT family N-acetyltransferase [Verrucomicrobiae bacterium]
MATGATIRPACAADLEAINGIYNYYVSRSTCTYQEEAEWPASRWQWFKKHDDRHPIIVAEENGGVIGWGSLSPYHPRSAYRFTVENSIYVHHAHHRRGIGSLLLAELISCARRAGHRAIIAAIDAEQAGSIRLHARQGFAEVGRFRQVGFKFNRWLDVVYMELLLPAV